MMSIWSVLSYCILLMVAKTSAILHLVVVFNTCRGLRKHLAPDTYARISHQIQIGHIIQPIVQIVWRAAGFAELEPLNQTVHSRVSNDDYLSRI